MLILDIIKDLSKHTFIMASFKMVKLSLTTC